MKGRMILTISKIGKAIIMNSPVKQLGYSGEDLISKFGINHNSFYSSLEWGIRSAEILKRDNFTCHFCGDKYANYVHHIRSMRKYPEICLHPDFLITSCVSCHNHVHRK